MIDIQEIFKRAIKYLIEGGAVAAAAFYIPRRKMILNEIIIIAITAAATFAILDLWAPHIGVYARQGTGFGIGSSLVGASNLPSVPPM